MKYLALPRDEHPPMSTGLFRLEKGNSIIYEYTYEEMKIILVSGFHTTDDPG
jgi:hypothetical protein